jgi:hypothetical protein
MSKKEEIKNLIITDLENSEEQQFFNLFVEELKSSIIAPGVQMLFSKNFDNIRDEKSQEILRMISIKELGFEAMINEYNITVRLKNFME